MWTASTQRIFVAREAVDFRKAHDGLCAIVRRELDKDPTSGDVFAFFNKRRDRIKLLVWERNGFWLHYKRLERGTFDLPRDSDGVEAVVTIDARQLQLLLGGIDLENVKYRRHHRDSLRIDMSRDGKQSKAAG